jgi:peptidoglycan hydrolase-like protein with peptidoglycan-binding domain
MEVIENQGGISMSNNALSYFNGGKKSAYCPEVESYAKAHKRFVDKKSGKKGDVALFDFGKGRASHTGIVAKKTVLGYIVIEGNTSLTSNDNGGKVMKRTRTTKHIRGFYRPKYDELITADMIVAKAESQIGTKESPAGSNKVKYNTWYYGKEVSGSAYPWCMAFVSWVFAHTEVKAKAVSHNATAAKATSVSTSNKNVGTSKTKVATPKLKYSKTVEEYQKAYNVSYGGHLSVDGLAGAKTKATFEKIDLYRGVKHKATIVKFVQKKVGATADGIFGKNTEAKVKAYQKKYGIPNTGRVKKKTITKMVLG